MNQSPYVIAIANQKGGVGKTTTTMNLGVALCRKGFKVLLIDHDPQANLTSYLGVTPEFINEKQKRCLDELYLNKRLMTRELMTEFLTPTRSGVDLIASDSNLSGVEYYLFSRSDKELILSKSLVEAKPKYDFILIDTPPSINLLTLNALHAADYIIVPVQAEFFSLEGIVKIKNAIQNIKTNGNPNLEILGIVATQVPARRKLTQEVLTILKNELPDQVFKTVIHDNAAVTESSGHGKSVIEYQYSSRGSQEYLALCDEIIEKLNVVAPIIETPQQKRISKGKSHEQLRT